MTESDRYDDDYRKSIALFGEAPDPLLVEYLSHISIDQPVLDVGAGQGRHALHLAELGYEVDAIDPSSVGIEQLRSRAASQALSLRVQVAGWEDFPGTPRGYGAVLLFGLVQLLTRAQIDALAQQSSRWLVPGGLLFVTGHTTDDAGCAMRASDPAWSSVDNGTFVGPDGQLRTYLRPGEVLERFGQFEVVHHWEGMGPEHRHGDGPLERHACVRAVLCKPW
jgi:cyclopropane fatty-acyl-phospholipid synthase-like methyltransferase